MINKLSEDIFNKKYLNRCPHLCKDKIIFFLNETLHTLFPQMGQKYFKSQDELEKQFNLLDDELDFILKCIEKELDKNTLDVENIRDLFFKEVLSIEEKLMQDAQLMAADDPASKSLNEVIICYPGFYAIAVYRLAHFFYQQDIPLLPRILSEYAHQKTGIDIHPGAKIEAPFFIDHGTGIVIGETTIIGKNCKIFQGVTLGALSVKRKYKDRKRHPTIQDNCLIYANTTILGGHTLIGEHSIIGGNVWLTESIEAYTQVYRKHDLEIELIKKE